MVTRTKITPSSTLAVELAEVKAYIRMHDGTAEDDEVEDCIKSATDYCEGKANRSFLTSTWQVVAPSFFADEIRLSVDTLSVTSVIYTDTNGTDQTAEASTYLADTDSFVGTVRPLFNASWPDTRPSTPNAVRITYTAGYGATVASLPTQATRAIKFMSAYYFLHRLPIITGTIVAKLPETVDALLAQIAAPEII